MASSKAVCANHECRRLLENIISASRRRRCVDCGVVYCGSCKRKFMSHIGWRKWKCKGNCTSLVSGTEDTFDHTESLDVVVHRAELKKDVGGEMRCFVFLAVVNDLDDQEIESDATASANIEPDTGTIVWDHRACFRRGSYTESSIHVSLRSDDDRVSLGSFSTLASATWPWELKSRSLATKNADQEQVTTTNEKDIQSNTHWVPLQSADGENMGRIQLTITYRPASRDVVTRERSISGILSADPSTPAVLESLSRKGSNDLVTYDDSEVFDSENRFEKVGADPSSIDDDDRVDVLLKRSRWRRRWNLRRFVLRGNVLQHFASDAKTSNSAAFASVKVLGSRLLRPETTVRSCFARSNPKHWFEFEIGSDDSGEEAIRLAAPSDSARRAWIRALTAAASDGHVVLQNDHDRSVGFLNITVADARIPKTNFLREKFYVAVVEIEDVTQIVRVGSNTVCIPVSDPTADLLVRVKHTRANSNLGVAIVPLSCLTSSYVSPWWWSTRADAGRCIDGWFRLLPERSDSALRKFQSAAQGKLKSGLPRPQRDAWIKLHVEFQMRKDVNLLLSYLRNPLHPRSKWPKVPKTYTSVMKYKLKDRARLFFSRPRRWALHIRDLRSWRRPLYSAAVILSVWIVADRAEIWHLPLIVVGTVGFVSMLALIPHPEEGERPIYFFNDELENHEKTLWGKLWRIAEILGKLQSCVGSALEFVEKLEHSLTWEDPYATLIALVILVVIASLMCAALRALWLLTHVIPLRHIMAGLVSCYMISFKALRTSQSKGAENATLRMGPGRQDVRPNVVLRKSGVFMRERMGDVVVRWTPHQFILFEDKICCTSERSKKSSRKETMKLVDASKVRRVVVRKGLCGFEVVHTKSDSPSLIVADRNEGRLEELMSAVRLQISLCKGDAGRDASPNRPRLIGAKKITVATRPSTLRQALERWWDRVPAHREVLHRKIARQQFFRHRKNATAGEMTRLSPRHLEKDGTRTEEANTFLSDSESGDEPSFWG